MIKKFLRCSVFLFFFMILVGSVRAASLELTDCTLNPTNPQIGQTYRKNFTY